jgi:hypothetical protein
VDPGLHHLQGKAERVTPAELIDTLRTCHREKLAMRERHVAVARHVGSYEFNNTYQYVIAREDTHLAWLEAALADEGGTPETVAPPDVPAPGRKDGPGALIAEDAREAAAFAERWQPRLDGISHARHRTMLGVVVGETLEHQRFFEQMVGGRLDVLGRRSNGPGSPGTGDGVLPERWVG